MTTVTTRSTVEAPTPAPDPLDVLQGRFNNDDDLSCHDDLPEDYSVRSWGRVRMCRVCFPHPGHGSRADGDTYRCTCPFHLCDLHDDYVVINFYDAVEPPDRITDREEALMARLANLRTYKAALLARKRPRPESEAAEERERELARVEAREAMLLELLQDAKEDPWPNGCGRYMF
ncbi:hypothetical protein C8R46DRAFT_1189250 [Mycena filopes]|nr:hypothetical protein C8R46DRAFT_1189250 [Mycena filopes]